MTLRRNGLLLLLILIGFCKTNSAQNCFLPVLTNFSEPSTDGFTLHWTDNNPVVASFEIEYGIRGFMRTGIPDITDIQTTEVTLDGLQSGTSYEIYLRSICSLGDTSQWNGPYFNNTAIENNGICNLSLPINDNNCPQGQNFAISIDGYNDSSLGEDIILEKIKLIIDHPWPPDLEIRLLSPDDIPVSLSQYNGSGVDHYGNPESADCSESLIFSDNACLSITELIPPLIGDVRPETPIAAVFNGKSPNGLWRLFICDRANNDLGELKGVELIFSEEACTVPEYFAVTDIESDNITLKWASNGCENLRFSYKVAGAPVSEITSEFKECEAEEYQITGLTPDTEYELTVLSQCDEDSNSPVSCIYYFRTSCSNSTTLTDFDNSMLCSAVCDTECMLEGVWQNDNLDDSDWITNLGATQTSFTGPEGDKNRIGRYIYIENQPVNCPGDLRVNLMSGCLKNDGLTECQLSFFYHMYGQDIGTLSVEYRIDSTQWRSVFNRSGDQGNNWHFSSVGIPAFDFGQIRFSAQNSNGSLRGDIALDHIKLIGMDTIQPEQYFVDRDNDGYGSADQFIFSCSSVIPAGYIDNDEDCDDSNADINPAMLEIPCNAIDENCNGNSDDISPDDIIVEVLNQQDESCSGANDGIIELTIIEGATPIDVLWSNGMTGSSISQLGAGVYYASITDANGCSEELGPIILNAQQNLIYNLVTLSHPQCLGINDGAISLVAAGGSGTYSAIWNDGETGLTRSNLASGTYMATISDGNDCLIITDPIILQHGNPIVAGITLRRDVSCAGLSNGLLQVAANGGSLPYSINWNTGDSTFLLTNLSAGFYEVTIEGTNGCQTIINNIEVKEPDSLNIQVDNVEHITCPDGFDSFIDISVEGGTKPYTYLWSNGSFTEDIFNVESGLYSVTVSDFNACTHIVSDIAINEPDPMLIQLDSINSVNCVGSNRGYISVSTSGGNPPYSYNWSVDESDVRSESFLDSLGPGLYFLTVVDDFGCKSRPRTFEIFNQDKPINIALTQIEENLCFGDSIAAIRAVSTGVSVPLDFNWSNGSQDVKSILADTIIGLKADKYNLTITDSEGCVGISDSIEIADPAELQYTVAEIVNNQCFDEANGEIQLDVSGGTPPFAIEWSNGSQGETISNLENGNYSFELEDRNGCSIEGQNIRVISPTPIGLNAIITHPTPQSTGSIEVRVFGGRKPYEFYWSPQVGSTNDSIVSNLMMGLYNLEIVDSNGCTIDTSFMLDLINSVDEVDTALKTFPNPANERVYIKTSANIAQIILVDPLGAEHSVTQSRTSEHIILHTNALDSGVYYLLIELDNAKMVVEPLLIVH